MARTTSVIAALWRGVPFGLLAVAFLALTVAFGGNYSHPDNVHSAVYSWSQEHPGEEVPVLVETTGGTQAVAAAVAAEGGTAGRSFEMISTLEARVPASAVSSLAARDDIAWMSLDAPVVSTGLVDVSQLVSTYPFSVNAPAVWNHATTPYNGAGIGIAVIDSGVSQVGNADFADAAGNSRVVDVVVNTTATNADDGYGHGTHVAGIAGGDGDLGAGQYVGIAPGATIYDVKIGTDSGGATLSDVLGGIQWAVDNQYTHNIRVMNLSLNSSVAQSYNNDPLDAAVEFAWVRGIVVVVAAGNLGTVPDAVYYPPANDPFVITIGATDEMGTASRADDVVAFFSSRGITQDGFAKPDFVAPGRYIYSDVAPGSVLAQTYPDRMTPDGNYMRLSGTSMSAPVVTGMVALMLQKNPALTPGQVKTVLQTTSQALALDASAKHVLADAAVYYVPSGVIKDANAALSPGRQVRMNFTAKVGAVAHVLGAVDPAAEALLVGLDLTKVGPLGVTLATVDWNAIKWNAIKWDAIKWDLIKWDAIKWDAIKWDVTITNWDAIKWDVIKWGAIKWEAIKWNAIKWDAIKWDALKWQAITLSDAVLTGVEFSSAEFDSFNDSDKKNPPPAHAKAYGARSGPHFNLFLGE